MALSLTLMVRLWGRGLVVVGILVGVEVGWDWVEVVVLGWAGEVSWSIG